MKYKYFYYVPALAMMILIFSFSMEDADTSTDLSNGVTGQVIDIIDSKVDIYENTEERTDLIVQYDFLIRKGAHFSEYALLAILVSIGLYFGSGVKDKRLFTFAVLTVFIYACTDEVHQFFVPGRACRLFDICIDTLGGTAGALVYLGISKLVHKKSKK